MADYEKFITGCFPSIDPEIVDYVTGRLKAILRAKIIFVSLSVNKNYFYIVPTWQNQLFSSMYFNNLWNAIKWHVVADCCATFWFGWF